MYAKALVALAVTLGVTSPGRAQSLPTDLEDLRGRWNLVLPTIRVLGSPGFPCRFSPEPYETGIYFSREAGRSGFDMYYDVNGRLVYMGEGTIRNGVFNMLMNRVDGIIQVRFTGRMQHGLNDAGEHISSITGDLTCGDAEANFFITRWNPNVKPDGMPSGTAEYYRFRDADFRKRHPQQAPPEYYLQYGARYVNVLSVSIRDRLSPQGQRFVADVAGRLQRMMDSLIIADPAGFDALETSGSLEDFAFSSHVDAYCGAGGPSRGGPGSDREQHRHLGQMVTLSRIPHIRPDLEEMRTFTGRRPGLGVAPGVGGKPEEGRRDTPEHAQSDPGIPLPQVTGSAQDQRAVA